MTFLQHFLTLNKSCLSTSVIPLFQPHWKLLRNVPVRGLRLSLGPLEPVCHYSVCFCSVIKPIPTVSGELSCVSFRSGSHSRLVPACFPRTMWAWLNVSLRVSPGSCGRGWTCRCVFVCLHTPRNHLPRQLINFSSFVSTERKEVKRGRLLPVTGAERVNWKWAATLSGHWSMQAISLGVEINMCQTQLIRSEKGSREEYLLSLENGMEWKLFVFLLTDQTLNRYLRSEVSNSKGPPHRHGYH